MALHPAEIRGFRELYLTGRHLVVRWRRVAGALDPGEARDALDAASQQVDTMLAELEPLTAKHGLHSRLAAQGTGARLGTLRGAIGDRFLERNQAVRLAVCELEHVAVLLAYLATVSRREGDADLAEFCSAWQRRLAAPASALREAVVELGADPDTAVSPLDASPAGRVAHGAAQAVGTVGEWIDRRTARR